MPKVFGPSGVAWVRRIDVGTVRRWYKEGRLQPWPVPGGGTGDTPVGTFWRCWARVLPGGDQAASVYARVRTGKQAETGNPERQRLRLMEYAARKGYRLVLQASDVAAGTVGLCVPGDAV